MKCQLAQGFLFSKPLHKEKMEKLLANMDRFACLNPHLPYGERDVGSPSKADPESKSADPDSSTHDNLE
jgi:hypothetical protein